MDDLITYRCLVVDDEPELTEIIAFHFTKIGIHFDVCHSGADAAMAT